MLWHLEFVHVEVNSLIWRQARFNVRQCDNLVYMLPDGCYVVFTFRNGRASLARLTHSTGKEWFLFYLLVCFVQFTSLLPKPFPPPVFDHLQYAKTLASL